MPKIPQPNYSRCGFPKYRGELWTDIVKDPDGQLYMEWLVGLDGPTMTEGLYNHIQSVLEDFEAGDI